MKNHLDNPPNPFHHQQVEYLEPPPEIKVEVREERAKTILSENDSPDLPFRWCVNPYRGCQHGCIYCYARPYHEYLDLGAGTDFETRLFAKINAPELLRKALASPKWTGESIHFSGVTDCYQPIEAVYHLTQRCLQVCLDFQNPVAVITRSYQVVRDRELLAQIHRLAGANVCFSIPFADDELSRVLEPHAPVPSQRFQAMRSLHDAGIPVGLLLSPIIPGLNDREIPRVIEQAAAAGARSSFYEPLRLPGSLESVFMKRLRERLPLRFERVQQRLREIRGGRLSDSRFGHRLHGRGEYWDSIVQLFEVCCRKFGLGYCHGNCTDRDPSDSTPRCSPRQMTLPFDV